MIGEQIGEFKGKKARGAFFLSTLPLPRFHLKTPARYLESLPRAWAPTPPLLPQTVLCMVQGRGWR